VGIDWEALPLLTAEDLKDVGDQPVGRSIAKLPSSPS
jgi:hypothetical protein